jgi:hypothetical protein
MLSHRTRRDINLPIYDHIELPVQLIEAHIVGLDFAVDNYAADDRRRDQDIHDRQERCDELRRAIENAIV